MLFFLRMVIIFVLVSIGTTQVYAVIISGHRISFSGLGTLILLGDAHKSSLLDDAHYQTILSYLKLVTRVPNETSLNVETSRSIHEYYKNNFNQTIKEQRRSNQVLTKLRMLMAVFKEKEGLAGSLNFAVSDPRNSAFWNIVRLSTLRSLVRNALTTTGNSSSTLELFSSFEEDSRRILEKHTLFKQRAYRELTPRLYQTIEKILSLKIRNALTSKGSLVKLFNRYTAGKPLHSTSISTIIYQFSLKHHPELTATFSTSPAYDQERIVDSISRSFYENIGKTFREQYYLPIANLPWLVDSIHTFLTPQKAKRAIIYAGSSHIKNIVAFIEELQAALGNDGTIQLLFRAEGSTPLPRSTLEKILDFEIEKKRL